MGQSFETPVKFPESGDVAGMRKWLDKNNFFGLFTDWDSDALLGQSDEYIASRFDTTVEGLDNSARLCGLLNSARKSKEDLFEYFKVTPPPECYGTEFVLPDNLRFPFDSKYEELNRMMIVRQCYERIISIVNKRLNLAENRGKGIIFSGAQGNGKTWLSLLIVWELVFQGKTVVYELCEQEIIFVIPVNGPIRLASGSASGYSSGSANIASVRELSERHTVHVFDSTSVCRQPAISEAFLIMTTARNRNNYAQTVRLPNMYSYCIPSYKVSELLRLCARFSVTEKEVLQRCAEIGPSIRYILVTADYENCKNETMTVARNINIDDMEIYTYNVNMYSGSGNNDFVACLLVVSVREDLFDDPDDAYLTDNVTWEFASTALCRQVMTNVKGDVTKFVKKLITEVNVNDITNMKGIAGNFLELIVEDFICAGQFKQCRKLVDYSNGGNNVDIAEFTHLSTWEGVLPLQETNSTTVSEALTHCTDSGDVYHFCKTFSTGFSFAALGFSFLFQITNLDCNIIQLSEIKVICEHVRKTKGEDAKVVLLFIVPEATVKKDAKNWQYTRSFEFNEEKRVSCHKRKRGNDSGGDETVLTTVKTRQFKFVHLSVEDQHVLRNLEQWVVCFKE